MQKCISLYKNMQEYTVKLYLAERFVLKKFLEIKKKGTVALRK